MKHLVAIALISAFTFPASPYSRLRNNQGAFLTRSDYTRVALFYNDSLRAGARNANGSLMLSPDSDPEAAMLSAVTAWSTVEGSEIRLLRPAPTSAGLNRTDGRSVIVLLDTAEIRSIVGTATAVTLSTFDAAGRISESDILLNPRTMEQLGVAYSTTGNPGAFDLAEVLTHEIGHVLGAGHSNLMGAAMYHQPSGFPRRILSDDDRSFARTVAPNPGSTDHGEIRGTITLSNGTVGRGLLVVATDRETGATVSAVSESSGAYRLMGVPTGRYVIFAEPADGPSSLANLGLNPATTDLNAEAMFLGGAESPRVIPVAAGTVEVTDFTMGPSTGLVDLRFFARGSAGGATDSAGSTSPISLAPGQTIDLMIGGPGLDAAEPGAIDLLGPGVSMISGSIRPVRLSATAFPVLRFTVKATGAPRRALVSVIYRTGSSMSTMPGAIILAPVGEDLGLSSSGIVNAASVASGSLAPDSWVSLFGKKLAHEFSLAGENLASVLNGTNVEIMDSAGTRHLARIQFVAPEQINFLMPASAAPGATRVVVISPFGSSFVDVNISRVAPGIFAANSDGRGPAAATYLRIEGDGRQESGFTFAGAQAPFANQPVELGREDSRVYLTFHGTGIRGFADRVTATVGGMEVPVLAAVPQGVYAGLDQVNIGPLPSELRGRGEVEVLLRVDGVAANAVTLHIR